MKKNIMNKGDVFTSAFNINSEIYNGFVSLFKDKNPLHTNSEYAVGKGFIGKVMHGNILNGFLSFFVGECLPSKDVIIQTQQIKYLKPVYLNDELILHAEIEEIYDSVNTIELKYYFENQNKEKIAKGRIQIGLLK
jgi:3-hydroxybutyryl-CoA dehydratase